MTTGALTSFRYQFDTSSKKAVCPACSQKKLRLYKDTQTGEYLPEDIGKCDRANHCCYHATPGQKGIKGTFEPYIKPIVQVSDTKLDFIGEDLFYKTFDGFTTSNFATYIITLFSEDVAKKTLLDYAVGRSRMDNGKACIFWRIDIEDKIRTGKVMVYDPVTGKRRKEVNPTWVHAQMKPFNYQLCFFGEYLLQHYPNKPVAIVESEKTAIIASIFMPQFVWLATGGASGCKWREYAVYKVLANKKIVLFPDYGWYSRPQLKPVEEWRTCFEEWSERAQRIQEVFPCTMKVSRLLEDKLSSYEGRIRI